MIPLKSGCASRCGGRGGVTLPMQVGESFRRLCHNLKPGVESRVIMLLHRINGLLEGSGSCCISSVSMLAMVSLSPLSRSNYSTYVHIW